MSTGGGRRGAACSGGRGGWGGARRCAVPAETGPPARRRPAACGAGRPQPPQPAPRGCQQPQGAGQGCQPGAWFQGGRSQLSAAAGLHGAACGILTLVPPPPPPPRRRIGQNVNPIKVKFTGKGERPWAVPAALASKLLRCRPLPPCSENVGGAHLAALGGAPPPSHPPGRAHTRRPGTHAARPALLVQAPRRSKRAADPPRGSS